MKLEKPAALRAAPMQKPKGPLSGYMRFSRDNLEKVRNEYPRLTQTDLVSVTGHMWN